MADRITADSVVDDQIDDIYERVERLVVMHAPEIGWCECDDSPCPTFMELNQLKKAFNRRTTKEGAA